MNKCKDIISLCNELREDLREYLIFPENCDYVLFRYLKDDIESQYQNCKIDFTELFKELSDVEIIGEVEDIIQDDDECFLIISSDKYTKRCISVVSSRGGYIEGWEPRFDELFKKLMEYNSEIIYQVLIDISNEISNEEGEDIEDIINKNFAEYYSENDIELNLCLSVLREIMITEDIRFNKPWQRGRFLLIEAYEDIAIRKMKKNEWKKKYNLK